MKTDSFLRGALWAGIAAGGVLALHGAGAMAGAYPKCSFSGNGGAVGNNDGACTQTANGKLVQWNINAACTCPGVDPSAKTKCFGFQGTDKSSGKLYSCDK